jgi:hypothetical protein
VLFVAARTEFFVVPSLLEDDEKGSDDDDDERRPLDVILLVAHCRYGW